MAVYMAGIDLRWKEYHQDFSPVQEVLNQPSYKWDLKNYWIPYAVMEGLETAVDMLP